MFKRFQHRLLEPGRGKSSTQRAFENLCADPQNFLEHNIVQTLWRSGTNTSRVLYFVKERHDEGCPIVWCLREGRDPDLGGVDVPTSCYVNYIATVSCSGVNPGALIGERLPDAANCLEQLVVTARLSGCSFVWAGDGDGLFPECAHIQPLVNNLPRPVSPEISIPAGTEFGDEDGHEIITRIGLKAGDCLQADLQRNGPRFEDQPGETAKVFGKQQYEGMNGVNIIGVKQGLVWVFFAQILNGQNSIYRVERIAQLVQPAYPQGQ